MNSKAILVAASLAAALVSSPVVSAQKAATSSIAAARVSAVPTLVNFSGALTNVHGKPLTGIVGVTFLLYKDSQGGAPVWMETQNVTPDKAGHYTVQLGSTSNAGLPATVFMTGEARWLGVQVVGETEQSRILLVAVPYAMKAADAETVGGLPSSAFVLAMPTSRVGLTGRSAMSSDSASAAAAPTGSSVTTTGGRLNALPLWTTVSNIESSAVAQTGSGATAKIGIGTSTPASTLDINGTAVVRGSMRLPAVANATSAQGSNSQPLSVVGSSFDSDTHTAVSQTFRWQVEPVGNNTPSPSGSWNLLYAAGAAKAVETGLKFGSNGQIKFATGQTFPGTGTGTVTSINAGLGLTGGTITSSGTLAINPGVVAQLKAANTFSGNQTVNGNLTAIGVVTGSSYQIGSDLFAFGSSSTSSAYLGFAGKTTSTGLQNTAVGFRAMFDSTTGGNNTAVGAFALLENTVGTGNTAVGYLALNAASAGDHNTAVGESTLTQNRGSGNTAIGSTVLPVNRLGTGNTAAGIFAMQQNVSGNDNTGIGQVALADVITGAQNSALGEFAGALHDGKLGTFLGYNTKTTASNFSNVTAVGAFATVGESNALILGGTAGNAVSVGIGTSTPFNDYGLTLDATTNTGTIDGGIVVNGRGGNLYLGMTNSIHKFRVDLNGAAFADGGFQSSGADFAESVAVRGSRAQYEPGDVLEIDPTTHRGVTLSHHPYATLVAGIYSTKPGLLATPHPIDDPAVKTSEVPLAIMGIVPCKVTAQNGAIAPGDLLVTSSRPGYAMKGTDRRRMLGSVVGKALEPLAQGNGLIEVLVTLQ